jgi:catechol 2,3-dioxygenase-like lactoylglutathione lyase family enzyme
MIKLQDVSYVRLGTEDLDSATAFATDYLGLEIANRLKGAVYLKSDQREHTLCYFAGAPGDQTAAFEVAERADLGEAALELDRLGHRPPPSVRRRKPNCAMCGASWPSRIPRQQYRACLAASLQRPALSWRTGRRHHRIQSHRALHDRRCP